MIQPLDPFALNFDSIEVDAARPDGTSAFEHALALGAPTAAAPEFGPSGFYLLDDADGRFVVDREMGVISLKNEALLESERGAVHGVRLRVVEASGASYELDLKLRITGMVPQTVGGEAFSLLGEAAQERAAELTPVARVALAPPPRPAVAWERFAAAADMGAPASISCCGAVAYGMLLAAPLPAVDVSFASLVLTETTPPPSGRDATWSL